MQRLPGSDEMPADKLLKQKKLIHFMEIPNREFIGIDCLMYDELKQQYDDFRKMISQAEDDNFMTEDQLPEFYTQKKQSTNCAYSFDI